LQKKWKHGDLVTVVTVNKGLPVWSKEQDAAKSWAARSSGHRYRSGLVEREARHAERRAQRFRLCRA